MRYFEADFPNIGLSNFRSCQAQRTLILNPELASDAPYDWHCRFCTSFNIFLAIRLPLIEALVLVLHVLGVFVIIIPLWVTSPRGNAHDTIFVFTETGGWGDTNLASTIGMIPIIGLLIVSVKTKEFAM